ncbi:MAG: glycosyltransferase family 4 protein [Chloroflexota bacterium]|nr:MAG: glycosyltransferase family 4 protein [Chloroflexota bacterium]
MSSPGQERPRRIGIDITSALTQGAGIGRYTRELVSALVKSDSETAYTFFCAKRPTSQPIAATVPEAANVTFREAPLGERWLYRIWYRLALPVSVQLFTGELDLFHSPDFVLPPVRSQIPTLLTVHDLSFLHYPDTFTPSLVAYLNKVVPRSVRQASHVLADSLATRSDLIKAYDVPAEKVSVLYSGVSNDFRPVNDERLLSQVRDKYGIGERPYVLSVSTLQPRKNYQMLIQAFKDVAARQPHVLVIAGGKGWLYEQIVEEIARQELEGRVLLVGFAADEDLPALYSGASLFAYPSFYEGFGLPLLEAMACGVPVLNSNASCLPEVAGDATIQLSPHDQPAWSEALVSLLEDPSKRAGMVAAGFLQARRFTWSRAALELRSLYTRLLD